jgi:hypothetical protein
MTKLKIEVKRPAINELRIMVDYFNSQHEGVNSRFTHAELLKIWYFATSEQGGRVHECYDQWPEYLLNAVLKAKLGAKISEKTVGQAGKEC